MDGDNHPKRRAIREARKGVVARLVESFAQDELGLETFEQRIAEAYQCLTTDELHAFVVDLGPIGSPRLASALTPVPHEAARVEHVAVGGPRGETALAKPRRGERTLRAIFGNVEPSRSWRAENNTHAHAIFGSLTLDFREVVLPPGVTEVHLRAVCGSIEVHARPPACVQRGVEELRSHRRLPR